MDVLGRMLDGIRIAAPLIADMGLGGGASIDMLEGRGSPFYYVARGAIRLSLGSEMIDLAAGDMAFLPTWPRHCLHHGAGGPVETIVEAVEARGLPLWSQDVGLDIPLAFDLGRAPFTTRIFSGNFVMRSDEADFLKESLPPVIIFGGDDHRLGGWLVTSFDLLLSELDRPEPGFSAAAARALEMILVQALRRWVLSSGQGQGLTGGLRHANVRRALVAMHAEPARTWQLGELARLAGQSRSSFAETFRNIMGETPLAYLRRWRLQMAASRIRETRRSVPAIAAEVGYTSAYAFIRAFRAQYGSTPSAYRRRCRRAGSAVPEA
jgi:AraC-like DNA-binding protein